MAIGARQGIKICLSLRQAGQLLPLLLTLGCTEPAVETVELVVDNWWQKTSEDAAFREVEALHEAAHDNVNIVTISQSDMAVSIRTLTAQKLLARRPPATFQANIGADLLKWAVVNTENGDPSTRRIHGLSTLFQQAGLEAELPEPLLRQLRVGGSPEPFGVPINIHRENVLYYSQQKLTEFQQAHSGQSFLEPTLLCPEPIPENPLAKLDVDIAMSQEGWVRVLFAFENVLVSVAGAEFYESLFRGEYPASKSGADWKEDVVEALRCVQYLSRSFDRDPNIVDWLDAITAVQNNRAHFTVIGDWANGEIKGKLDSEEVKAVPFPRTEDAFVFTSDTFSLPVDVQHGGEVFEFLRTIASPQAQEGFSAKKGSIPALRSAKLDNARALETRQDFDTAAHVVLATSGLFPPYFLDTELHTALAQLVAPNTEQAAIDEAIAEVLVELENAMALFKRWQARLREPAGVLP